MPDIKAPRPAGQNPLLQNPTQSQAAQSFEYVTYEFNDNANLINHVTKNLHEDISTPATSGKLSATDTIFVSIDLNADAPSLTVIAADTAKLYKNSAKGERYILDLETGEIDRFQTGSIYHRSMPGGERPILSDDAEGLKIGTELALDQGAVYGSDIAELTGLYDQEEILGFLKTLLKDKKADHYPALEKFVLAQIKALKEKAPGEKGNILTDYAYGQGYPKAIQKAAKAKTDAMLDAKIKAAEQKRNAATAEAKAAEEKVKLARQEAVSLALKELDSFHQDPKAEILRELKQVQFRRLYRSEPNSKPSAQDIASVKKAIAFLIDNSDYDPSILEKLGGLHDHESYYIAAVHLEQNIGTRCMGRAFVNPNQAEHAKTLDQIDTLLSDLLDGGPYLREENASIFLRLIALLKINVQPDTQGNTGNFFGVDIKLVTEELLKARFHYSTSIAQHIQTSLDLCPKDKFGHLSPAIKQKAYKVLEDIGESDSLGKLWFTDSFFDPTEAQASLDRSEVGKVSSSHEAYPENSMASLAKKVTDIWINKINPKAETPEPAIPEIAKE